MAITLKHPELFADKDSWAILRENGTVSVNKMNKAPFLGLATSSKGMLQNESNLLTVHTSNGFDPDANKLMKKS